MMVGKDKRDCLFKNYELEPTTTATIKKKSLDTDEDGKILEQKRIRRLKDVKC